jgi:hypothetical protein
MSSLVFYAQFVASKVGKQDLTPTIDLFRVTRSDATVATVISGGSMTQVTLPNKRGWYLYRLSGADLQTYDYGATAITADSTVDQQEIACLWTRFSEAVTVNSSGSVDVGTWLGASPAPLISGQLQASISGASLSGVLYPPSGSINVNTFSSGLLTRAIPQNVLTLDYTYLSGIASVASGISGRCLLNATRKLTNRFSMLTSSGYLDVFQEDDDLLAYQQALSLLSGAAPIVSFDTR